LFPFFSKKEYYTVKTNPVLGKKVKKGKSVIWFSLEIPLPYQCTALDETFSLIWLLIGLSSTLAKITLYPVSPSSLTDFGLPKTGVIFHRDQLRM